MQTVCAVDIMVKPSSRIQHFIRQRLGLGTDQASMAELQKAEELKSKEKSG